MAKKVRVMETEYVDQLLECRGSDVAQPVLVVNRVSRTLSVDTRFTEDARTFAEERGDVLTFDIPLIKGETADRLMREVEPLAQTVCDSDEESDEFENAIDSISSVIDGYDADLEFFFADDWFDPRLSDELGLTPDTTDEEIQDLVSLEESSAGAVIIGAAEYMEKIRASLEREAE